MDVYNTIYFQNKMFAYYISKNSYYNPKIFKILQDKSRQSNAKLLWNNVLYYYQKYTNYDNLDPPSEFCDPIMLTIINNPVKNPINNLVMDKSHLERHLLTSNIDPFTRKNLDNTDVFIYNKLPKVEREMNKLKSRINNWKEKERLKM